MKFEFQILKLRDCRRLVELVERPTFEGPALEVLSVFVQPNRQGRSDFAGIFHLFVLEQRKYTARANFIMPNVRVPPNLQIKSDFFANSTWIWVQYIIAKWILLYWMQ